MDFIRKPTIEKLGILFTETESFSSVPSYQGSHFYEKTKRKPVNPEESYAGNESARGTSKSVS